ncbi:hypothetical protein O3M35_008066 [Rhynocoris fuscipes]|uniref:Uncharacterized protein n=1 Tax=Rhynocoris fuscipes TaxID=488301 RepID=A0AAW1D7N9_9HEMI
MGSWKSGRVLCWVVSRKKLLLIAMDTLVLFAAKSDYLNRNDVGTMIVNDKERRVDGGEGRGEEEWC